MRVGVIESIDSIVNTIVCGDTYEVMRTIPDCSIHCCVTSPPYWGLRDYGHGRQIGLEPTPEAYITRLVEVFREVRRLLRGDGTLWLNLGDSYAGSWGNYGGQNRGNGIQRTIASGSQIPNPAYEGLEAFRPPTASIVGLKSKDLVGIPWRVALALQADGWWLRQDIVWHKPNPMPESVRDRCTKSHEYVFLLSKSERYYFDSDAIKEPAVCGSNGSEFHTGKTGEHQLGLAQKVRPSKPKGSFNGKTESMASTGQNAFRAVTETRNKRSVWTIPTKPFADAHFAVMPPELAEPCVMAGCPEGGIVLDPFMGSGTVAVVARKNGCRFVGVELNPKYVEIANKRLQQQVFDFKDESDQ